MELIDRLKSLPDSPGVYHYFDKNGKLLYVGKAKSLKKRVRSYFRLSPLSPAPNLSPRIFKMISETEDLDYIVVNSEQDALILENSLIKQLKPKYNILLRDDKTYPYIYIDLSEEFPRPKITRKVVKGNVKYFGPFPSGARDILDSIYELFPLVQKDSCLKGKKACLFFQLKKCLAPCEGRVKSQTYLKMVHEAIELIHNKKLLISKLKTKMQTLSQELRFEEAAAIRDRIKNIEATNLQSEIDLASLKNLDIYAIEEEENQAAVVRMFLRDGKVISSSSNKIKFDRGFDRDEAYKRVLLEFYQSQTPLTSTNIITAHDFAEREDLSRFLSEKFGKKIAIEVPKKGKRAKLTELARLNAKELLKMKKEEDFILFHIKELLELENTPYKIEVFDNSHISGSVPVGAMAVFENGGFHKPSYRHYNLNGRDEYSQMRELITKRCESFEKNPPPDMWLIDGGETLRRLAEDIAKSFGVDMDVVAISKEKIDAKAHRAKGAAKDIVYASNGVFKLPSSDKRLHFLQRLRDEAHRFAITFHKKQRSKKLKEMELLKINGIGEAKLKKLLNYFGTFEEIKKASVEDISQVLNRNDAIKIKEHYN